MANDKIVVKVGTKEDLSGVKAIEDAIKKIENDKVDIDVETQQARTKLKELEALKEQMQSEGTWGFNVESSKVGREIANLKKQLGEVDDEPITPKVDSTSAQLAIQNLSQGFDQLKQGASELKNQMSEVLEASGRMENTETFLSMNIGAEQAKKKMEEIRNVTDKLPGDDVTLQNLLSQATIKDANMTAEAMTQMGSAAADYMAGMQNFGKSATETQQDLMNYILAGNTAEVERSPILQAHIDKLKEATTVQERSKALQEALNAEGWSGIAQQDTYNNKLQKFNDMLTRGQMNLGDMFREPTEDAMEFLMKLDEVSGGMVGVAYAGAQMATPLFDSALGLVQMASGLHNLTNGAGIIQTLKDKFNGLKSTITSVASTITSNLGSALSSLKNTLTTSIIPAIKNAALGLLELGKNALIAGANALKSATMWVAEKAAKLASAAASTALAIAQGILNAVMALNPITLVVIALVALAAALIWAYQNVDWFRESVNGAWLAITQLASTIWGIFKPAFDMISNTISGFTSKLGLEKDNWINSVLSFLIFIATLPVQLGVIFLNAIAKALGFGDNFVQKMADAALNAINGFIDWISQLPDKLKEELDRMLDMAADFAMKMADKMTFGGASMVAGWIGGSGEHSPGYMYEAFVGELSAMEKAPNDFDFSGGMKDAGSSMVSSFNPNIGTSSTGVIGTNNITINIESVDNEDRIQEIVEAVEEALKFDNLTAGRTV